MIGDTSTEPFGAGPYARAQQRLHLGRPGDSAVRRRMLVVATLVPFIPVIFIILPAQQIIDAVGKFLF